MKKLLILFAVLLGVYSCTDESKFVNPSHFQLENGSFVRFAEEQGLAKAVDLNSFTGTFVNGTVEDVNNNTSEYSLSLTAFVAGTTYVVEDFVVLTSFPSNLEITMQQIADAAGFDASTIDFGDSFAFVAKTTRNDGQEFYAVAPSFSSSNLTVGIGNTDIDNLNKPGYRDAMLFDFIFACPSFIQADIVGTYRKTTDGFNVDYNNDIVQIVAGSNENEFIIQDFFGHAAQFPGMGPFDITVSVASDGTNVTVARQPAFNGSDSNNFGAAYGEGRLDGSGLVFSCLGTINLNLTPTVDAGSFGARDFVLEKQ